MPLAFSYIRFSGIEQRKGTSEARQEETPEPWCKANGYTLDRSLRLRDLGRSGYHGHNVSKGALGVFLNLVKDGRIERGSVLLIEHLDRFTRQAPIVGIKHIQSIIEAGIDIVTLIDGERYSEERLTKDFSCLMLLMFKLFQGFEESDKKHKRLSDVWRRKRDKARTGERISRRCPAWIDADTGEVIEGKADVIRRIFALAVEGKKGPNKIARQFNEEGVPPIGKAGRWAGGLVRCYLTSRNTIGEFQPCREIDGKDVPEGDPVPNFYPAIVDRTTFLTVQQDLEGRKRLGGVRGRIDDSKNLFIRMLFNLYDGGRYNYKENHDKRGPKEYTHKRLIPLKKRDGVPGAMDVAIDYESFEASFFTFVRALDLDSVFAPIEAGSKGEELAALRAELLEIDDKLRQLKERIKRSKNLDALLDMIEDLGDDRAKKAKRVEALNSELVTSEAKIFEDMRALLEDPDARGKVASAIRLLIDRIEILPIHTKTGRHKKTYYLLYVEVHFNNGQVRSYVTDETGADEPRAGFALEDGTFEWGPKLSLAFRTFKGTTNEFMRDNNLIRQLIEKASDEWKPRLLERFPPTSDFDTSDRPIVGWRPLPSLAPHVEKKP